MRKSETSSVLQDSLETFPRAVVAFTAKNVTKDWEKASHVHHKGQLLYSVRGVLNCYINRGIWIVPPQCAVWIPPGVEHSAKGMGETECYCLFIDTVAAAGLPVDCCTISVSPLLRELLLKVVGINPLYAEESPESRLVGTLLDEIVAAPVEAMHLPMPNDARLRRLAAMLLAEPAEKLSSHAWAQRVAMSERTMSRILLREVGMSFGRWRRQLHIILALQRLAGGQSVQAVAFELGYEDASSFVTMFRKAVGKPPATYLQERKHDLHFPVSTIILPQ